MAPVSSGELSAGFPPHGAGEESARFVCVLTFAPLHSPRDLGPAVAIRRFPQAAGPCFVSDASASLAGSLRRSPSSGMNILQAFGRPPSFDWVALHTHALTGFIMRTAEDDGWQGLARLFTPRRGRTSWRGSNHRFRCRCND